MTKPGTIPPQCHDIFRAEHYKDFDLILHQASQLAVPMPATAAAQQVYAIAEAKGIEEDVAAIIKVMEELAGVSAS